MLPELAMWLPEVGIQGGDLPEVGMQGGDRLHHALTPTSYSGQTAWGRRGVC